MNKSLFIYITYEVGLQSVGNLRNALNLGLSINNPRSYFVPSKFEMDIVETQDTPNAILIHDNTPVYVFCDNISKRASNYNKIFIAWHSHGNLKPRDIEGNCDFGCKVFFRLGTHISSNPLYSSALGFINNEVDAIEKAHKAFEGDTELNEKLNPLINIDPFSWDGKLKSYCNSLDEYIKSNYPGMRDE